MSEQMGAPACQLLRDMCASQEDELWHNSAADVMLMESLRALLPSTAYTGCP